MPEWLWEKRELMRVTPTIRDGIDYETECRYRKEGSRFISDVGADLNLKHDTVATGCVYFHRFFMMHSFKDFDRYIAALGCLFLAGKVEETPKKCKDIIKAARLRLTDGQLATFGEDPRLQEEVMTMERILLQTIKFDLQVEHPYQYLLKYAKILKGDQEQIRKMVQMAWTFINDSFCTSLCLQWEPEVLAVALMHLAGRLSKFDVVDWTGRNGAKHGRWWDQFVEDMSMDLLEDICHQVLDLYSNGKDKPRPHSSSNSHSTNMTAATSTASSPSPGGGLTKTPNTPATPNQLTPILSFGAARSTPQPQHTSTSAPPTPGSSSMHHHHQQHHHPLHNVSVPPPLPPPNSAIHPPPMPTYAYSISAMPGGIPPPPPPGPPMGVGGGGIPYPPMPPPPPHGAYAPPPPMPPNAYNYGVPPPPPVVTCSAPPFPPHGYAMPTAHHHPYGPPPPPVPQMLHYDYRTAGPPPPMPPVTTYGTPTTIPHAYNVPPPPPPHLQHMNAHAAGGPYGGVPPPPPPQQQQHRMHHQPPPRRM